MHLLTVIALQGITGLYATTATDSALARKAIEQASAELSALHAQHRAHDVAPRLLEQLLIWGGPADTWEFAKRADSIMEGGRIGARLIGQMYQRGDTAEMRRRLTRMDPAWRARVVASLPSTAGSFAQPIVEQWGEPAMEAPLARAGRHYDNGLLMLFRGDTARAQQLLLAAIDAARHVAVSQRHRFISNVSEALLRAGHPTTLEHYVAARIDENVPWYARFQAAIHFHEVGRGEETRAMLDSMTATMPADLSQQHRYRFMKLLHLARATSDDSTQAGMWSDSLEAARRATLADPRMRREDLMLRIHATVTGGTPRELAALLADTLDGRVMPATYLGNMAEYLARPLGHAATDSVQARVEDMLEVLWRDAARLTAAKRDTLREGVARAWRDVDLERALGLAERIETVGSRDRAVAHAIVELSAADAERAVDLAATLHDADARNVAYRALTARAVAGGRLRTAAMFAERTASGEARVAAQVAVAQLELNAHRAEAARLRLRTLLPEIDGEEAPDAHAIPAPPGTPRRGIDWRVLSTAIRTAIRAGLRDDLQVWASSRATAPARATAWTTIAESLAAEKLRWHRYAAVY